MVLPRSCCLVGGGGARRQQHAHRRQQACHPTPQTSTRVSSRCIVAWGCDKPLLCCSAHTPARLTPQFLPLGPGLRLRAEPLCCAVRSQRSPWASSQAHPASCWGTQRHAVQHAAGMAFPFAIKHVLPTCTMTPPLLYPHTHTASAAHGVITRPPAPWRGSCASRCAWSQTPPPMTGGSPPPSPAAAW